MNFYNIGDTSRALCGKCKAVVPTTFYLRNVPLSDGSGVAKNVLVSVCDQCGEVCGIPQQSLPLVQETVKKAKEAIEARVSVAIDDLFKVACMKIGASTDFQSTLIRYYANTMSKEETFPGALKDFIEGKIVRGKKTRRISIKGENVKADFEVMKSKLRVRRYVDCIEAVAFRVNEDIIEEHAPDKINELKTIYKAAS